MALKATITADASMRPRPIPRKTMDGRFLSAARKRRFNEAAADTAENARWSRRTRTRPRRFNEAAADTAENGAKRPWPSTPAAPLQ